MDKLVSPDPAVNAYMVDAVARMLAISNAGLRCGAIFDEIQKMDRMLAAAADWRRTAMGRFQHGLPRLPYPNPLFPPQILMVRTRLQWMLVEAAAANRAAHSICEPPTAAEIAERAAAARREHNLRLARAH